MYQLADFQIARHSPCRHCPPWRLTPSQSLYTMETIQKPNSSHIRPAGNHRLENPLFTHPDGIGPHNLLPDANHCRPALSRSPGFEAMRRSCRLPPIAVPWRKPEISLSKPEQSPTVFEKSLSCPLSSPPFDGNKSKAIKHLLTRFARRAVAPQRPGVFI